MVKSNYPKTVCLSEATFQRFQELKPKRMVANDYLWLLMQHFMHCPGSNKTYLYKDEKPEEKKKGWLSKR